MRTHHDWSTHAFTLPPTAPATGPFSGRGFLGVVAEAAGRRECVRIVESDDALVVLDMEDRIVRMAGDTDLTDYHAPLGEGVARLIEEVVTQLPAGLRLSLDSLPAEACTPIVEGLDRAGVVHEVRDHTVTAVLDLPATYEDYLAGVGKKQRHEIRRKRRRYVEAVGGLELVTEHQAGPGFNDFIRLHRSAAGDKGRFMTAAMESFFSRLVAQPGWRVDYLRHPGTGTATACVFGFCDDTGYYLYNSAYDPAMADASPGVAVVEAMIERALVEGRSRFDFLKGDEEYKFRLGASRRPLYRVEAVT